MVITNCRREISDECPLPNSLVLVMCPYLVLLEEQETGQSVQARSPLASAVVLSEEDGEQENQFNKVVGEEIVLPRSGIGECQEMTVQACSM